MEEVKLPPLPEGAHTCGDGWPETHPTFEQMTEYARQAVLAEREAHRERVDCWHEYLRDALGVPEDAPRRFDYYAGLIAAIRSGKEG